MIELFQFSTSPFTEKVRRAMGYKRIAYRVTEVERLQVPQGKYKHVSPTGKFPAILDGDKAIWDSTDILHHIDQNYDGPAVIPTNPRDAAMAHAIEEWADESLYFYEILMRLAWKHNQGPMIDALAASMPNVPREQLEAMVDDNVGKLVEAQGIGKKPREQILSDLDRHFGALDALLDGHDWLVGNTPSIADFAVIGQLTALLYAKEGNEALAQTRNVEGWIARLQDIAPLEAAE